MWACLLPRVQATEIPVAAAATDSETRYPTAVMLHVYDLGTHREVQAMNAVLSRFGTGAFHCGVEVYGREWSFQFTNKGTGVFQCAPKGCKHHTFRQSIAMGSTNMTEDEVDQLIGRLQKGWPARGYEVLTRNCCHCCDEMCISLGVGPIPVWTTNLASAGATVRSVYEGVADVFSPLDFNGCLTPRKDATDQETFSDVIRRSCC